MATYPQPNAATEGPFGYHGAVCDFKRRLIEHALRDASGNRTHAARVLGLQRTYLLRLMRELHVIAPPPPPRRGRPPSTVMPSA
jgi:DNA-binding NtrC family response regulator